MKPIMMGCGPPYGEETARRGSKWKDEKSDLLWINRENVVKVNARCSCEMARSLVGWAIDSSASLARKRCSAGTGELTEVPVAQLMTQNSLHLGRGALINQSVVDDNVLRPRQTVKVPGMGQHLRRLPSGQRVDSRVRVRAALAAINDVEVLERETELASQLVDTITQVTLGQGCELVEKWLDWCVSLYIVSHDSMGYSLKVGKMICSVNWIKSLRIDLSFPNRHAKTEVEYSHEEHEEWDKALAGPFDDLQETRQDRQTDGGAESVRLDLVHCPQVDSLLVEAVSLFEDKVVIV